MPVREAALRPLYKKIDALITDKVKDFFEMADGYSDVVVENGNTPYSRPLPHQPCPSISPGSGPLLLALAFACPNTSPSHEQATSRSSTPTRSQSRSTRYWQVRWGCGSRCCTSNLSS